MDFRACLALAVVKDRGFGKLDTGVQHVVLDVGFA